MISIMPPLLAILTIFFPVWFVSLWLVSGLQALQEHIYRKKQAEQSGHFDHDGETTPGKTGP